ncbi:MAG: chromate efflux transporter [Smithellaceae bacterium]
MKRPALLEILKTALYIGTIGYGGPAILALMKKVIVHEKAWLTEEEFMNALSLAQILPGAVGVTLFGYIGHKLRAPWGGLLAPFAFAFPAMSAITVLAWAYFTYGNLNFVHSIFMGLGAMVVALLVNATMMMGKSVFPKSDHNSYKGIAIVALAFSGMMFLRWNVVYIILISGLLGFLFLYFSGEFGEVTMPPQIKVAIVPPKVRRWQSFLPVFVTVGLLFTTFWFFDGTWIIFVTFLKIGALGFGGGFTAIPLIQHIVVDGMHWLDLTAFRDGIALGQITPGPVFITATFIGYKIAGIIGALVASLGIFAPSLAAIILLSHAHAKVQNLKIIKAVIKGFLSGFIGMLLFIIYQFAFHSLISWQTWLIFTISILYLVVWKKDAIWLILGTIGVSLVLF